MEINRKLYSVVSPQEYADHQNLYNPKNTAIEIPGTDVVLPIRNPNTDTEPGVYYTSNPANMMLDVVKPSEEEQAEYSADKIIDFTNVKDVGEVIQRNELLRNIQEDLMVSGKENILCLTTGPNDTPEMKALKGAINAKQIDKKLYEDRFAQFQNNMRLLKGSSITLSKMIEICNGFDIACELTLRDKDGAVNPMNTEISLDLTEGRPIKN